MQTECVVSAELNITEYLLGGIDRDAVALITPRSQHTYGELTAAVDRVGQALLDRGGAKGDRVLLVGDNSLFWVASYLGILRAGLVAVPLAPRMSAGELEFIVERAEPKFALMNAKYMCTTKLALANVQILTEGILANPQSEHLVPEYPSTEPSDLAAIMFTSGSTGRPRGVMISHGNIAANTDSIIEYLALTPNDRIMTVLPFHYCFGTSLLHTHLRVGGSLVLDPRFMFPEKVLENMRQTECTGFAGVPSHYQILLRNSSIARMQFPKLRYVQQAGGHLAPMFVSELRRALPTTQVFIMYGQTEATARLSYLPPECLDSKLGSIGIGIPGVTLRVVDDHGRPVVPGEVGELVAEGHNVALGYWRDNDEPRSFRDGRLYTGDLARVDEDGFFYIVDRAKDILKCGGKRVSCRTVEDALLGCDALLEAAVTAIPDDVLGEAVKAYVVPRSKAEDPLLIEKVVEVCRKSLPPQLIPKQIVVLHALPKNASGKVMKAALKLSGKQD